MRRGLSIRTYIALLVVGTVLPFLVFSGLLVDRSAAAEQELIARTVRNAAQGAAGDINRQLAGLQLLALALADSSLLQTGDLAAFHVQASELVRRQDLTAVLYDTAGQQLLNTAAPFGADLPAEPMAIGRVVETGRTDISDLATDARTGRPIVSIAVPVIRDRRLAYVLSVQISNAVAAVMAEQLVLPEQTVGLVDRLGSIIYRTRDPDQFIGLRAPPNFLSETNGRDDGAFLSNHALWGPDLRRVQPRETGWLGAGCVDPAPGPVCAGHALADATAGTRSGHAAPRGFHRLGHRSHHRQAGRWPVTICPGADGRWTSGSASAHAYPRSRRGHRRHACGDGYAATADRAAAARRERPAGRGREPPPCRATTGASAEDGGGGPAHRWDGARLQQSTGDRHRQSRHAARGAGGRPGMRRACRRCAGGSAARRRIDPPDAGVRSPPILGARTCDINQVIGVIVGLLRRTLGEAIVIELRLASDLWPVLIDRVQFEAAITNLATNARDAMPRGGQLTITTRNTHLDEDYAATHSEVASGDYVSIEVHDTGTGIPPEVLDHVFEPFFTTKEPGQGTGLGLSMVFGFLKQTGGHINAYSEVGEGTTFRLYLPPVHDAVTSDDTAVQLPPELGHNETILVVEDSAGLRQVLSRQLNAAGYRVLEAADGRAAREKIESNEAIDLLLTDIVMPGGMNGHELVRLAAQLRPNLKTLLTTGFSDLTNGRAAAASTPVSCASRIGRKSCCGLCTRR